MKAPNLRLLPFLILLLPLDVLVAISLLSAFLAASIYGRRFSHQDGAKTGGGHHLPLRGKRATIQILNWDGKDLLKQCLPSVMEAVRSTGNGHVVLVVDNGSTDGSVEFVRENFPDVHILELDRNYGFVGGNNRGVASVDTDIVVFLNNDMIVDAGFLQPLLSGFSDDSVFAVTSQIFFEDRSRRRQETGKTRAKFEHGFIQLWHADIDPSDEKKGTLPVFWAGGGSCAFDRRKYLEIGGLDNLYHPFYVEDADLSYQAWKRGWTCWLAPGSHVVHKHRSTSGRRFGHRFVDNTTRRNIYLFLWKNVSSFQMLLEHVVNLPRTHARSMRLTDPLFEVQAYVRAVVRLPQALSNNLRNRRCYTVDDREVFARAQT
jgi:GT2 family glycosyltransferase